MGYDNKVEVDRVTINEDFLIDEAVDALEALWDVLEGEYD
jgi:RNAse (barnase) inhibitor barstar